MTSVLGADLSQHHSYKGEVPAWTAAFMPEAGFLLLSSIGSATDGTIVYLTHATAARSRFLTVIPTLGWQPDREPEPGLIYLTG